MFKGFDLIFVLVAVAWAIIGGISQSRAKKKKAEAAAKGLKSSATAQPPARAPAGRTNINVSPRQARAARIRAMQVKARAKATAKRQQKPVVEAVAAAAASHEEGHPHTFPTTHVDPPRAQPTHAVPASKKPVGEMSRRRRALRRAVVYKTILDSPVALATPSSSL